MLTIKHLKEVRNFLHDVAVKWRDIGIELGLNIGMLQCIEQHCRGDPKACLCELLILWLKSTDPRPSCAALADALRAKAVGESALADQGRGNMWNAIM